MLAYSALFFIIATLSLQEHAFSLQDSQVDPDCKSGLEMGLGGYLTQCYLTYSGVFLDKETEMDVKLYRLDPQKKKYELAEDLGTIRACGVFDVKNITTDLSEYAKSVMTIKPHSEESKKSTYLELTAPFLRVTEEQGYARVDNRTYLRGFSGEVDLVWADVVYLVANKGDSVVFEDGLEDLSITWVDRTTKENKDELIPKGSSYTFKESNIYMIGNNLNDEEWFENPSAHVKVSDKSRLKIKSSGEQLVFSAPSGGFKIISEDNEVSLADLIHKNFKYALSILIILCVAFIIISLILIFALHGHFKSEEPTLTKKPFLAV